MLPDAECIKICCEILTELELGDFIVKINNRKILDGMFEVCGVPKDKFRTICSAVDKLDKMTWEEVRKEMVEEKGLASEAADMIQKYVVVKSRGGSETLAMLQADESMMNNKRAKEGINEMDALLKFCRNFKCDQNVSFDLSLARGLDYYTGVIYEAVMVGQVGFFFSFLFFRCLRKRGSNPDLFVCFFSLSFLFSVLPLSLPSFLPLPSPLSPLPPPPPLLTGRWLCCWWWKVRLFSINVFKKKK